MHPRIQELVDYVDAQRIVLRRAIEAVPPALRDVPPAPGQWSPGGIVEHLAIVSGRVTKLVAVRVADARAAGVGLETRTNAVLPTLNIERVLARSRRAAAHALVHPP